MLIDYLYSEISLVEKSWYSLFEQFMRICIGRRSIDLWCACFVYDRVLKLLVTTWFRSRNNRKKISVWVKSWKSKSKYSIFIILGIKLILNYLPYCSTYMCLLHLLLAANLISVSPKGQLTDNAEATNSAFVFVY